MNDSNPSSDAGELTRLQAVVRANRQTIHRLRERIDVLERSMELVCDDPQMQWLYRHRSERMDATVPMFPELRARFHLARYEFACKYVDGLNVADIACGTGYGCRVLIETGKAQSVTGIDICPEAIEYAKSRHQVAGVRFFAADALQTGIPDQSVDCVVSFETIEHLENAEALMDEFYRIMKPGGRLICSTPNAWPLEIAPHHVREYNKASFSKLLDRRFKLEELYNQNSGSDFRFNHEQAEGIVATTDKNHLTAECFIAIARRA